MQYSNVVRSAATTHQATSFKVSSNQRNPALTLTKNTKDSREHAAESRTRLMVLSCAEAGSSKEISPGNRAAARARCAGRRSTVEAGVMASRTMLSKTKKARVHTSGGGKSRKPLLWLGPVELGVVLGSTLGTVLGLLLETTLGLAPGEPVERELGEQPGLLTGCSRRLGPRNGARLDTQGLSLGSDEGIHSR